MIIYVGTAADKSVCAGVCNYLRAAGLFCAAADYSGAPGVCRDLKAKIALVSVTEADAVAGDNSAAASVCAEIRRVAENVAIVCLLGAGLFGAGVRDCRKYLHITGSDYQLDMPFKPEELLKLVNFVYDFRFGMTTSNIKTGQLFIDRIRGEAVFFGIRLPLTRSEAAILRFLAYCYPDGRSTDNILAACFAPGRHVSAGNIAVHICMINRKAKTACGLPLIDNRKKSGYSLIYYV